MVMNTMKKFEVPLKNNDWVKKWFVDVHNIALPKKLDWISLLKVSEGFTQDISKFYFHIWEPVWFLNH